MADQILERFWEKVNVDISTGCWNFTSMLRNGYGRFRINYKIVSAHRFAYEVNKGKIPKELELDHLCKNLSCVNPQHLEPVTHKENILRGNAPSALVTRTNKCMKGHLLLGDNLYLNISNGERMCKKCAGNRRREYYKKYGERPSKLLWNKNNPEKLKDMYKRYNQKRKEKSGW